MKSILRRLSRLETRLEPTRDPVDGERARKELWDRLEAIRRRIPPEHRLPEGGPEAEAERKRIQEWLENWRRGRRETSGV